MCFGHNEPAVTIKDIENSIIDRAEEGWVKEQQPAESTGKKIAVVGQDQQDSPQQISLIKRDTRSQFLKERTE